MPPLPVPLTTERLRVRTFRPDDLLDLHRLQSDEAVATYLSRGVRSIQEVQAALERRLAPLVLDQAGDGVILALTTLAEDHVIGEVSLWLRDADARVMEVGFALLPEVQGRGYAHEAVHELVRLAFDHLAAREVIGVADRRNVASTSLMHRLGMVARPGDDETSPTALLVLDRRRWQSKRRGDHVASPTRRPRS